MGHTILIDFSEFETHVLRLKSSLVNLAPLPEKLVNSCRLDFGMLFGANDLPNEDAIAKRFIKMLNTNYYRGLLQKHQAAFTGNRSANDGTKSKVDAGIYPTEHVPPHGQANWTHIRLFIEFKRQGTSLDPFDDLDRDDPEVHAQSRQAVREQITDYALSLRDRQNRTCIFALFVIGPEFRVMRFDQSGIIVTKKQNYAADPRPLLSFLAWFDSLSAEQQGLDPTATLLKEGSRHREHKENTAVPASYVPSQPDASSSTPKAATQHPYSTRQQKKVATTGDGDAESYPDVTEIDTDEDPRVFRCVREKFAESLKHGWPRYKLEVGAEKRAFLVGKPVWTSSWLFGRGTRGYVALDVKRRRFVFLKDCWRPYYVGVEPEGVYLELLTTPGPNTADICVPEVVVHGDVEDQVALTAQFANSPCRKGRSEKPSSEYNADPPYRHLTHYCIILKDVCLPFTEIESSRQLVDLLYDCVVTHSLAYSEHQLLHRDVRAGNVIIRPKLSSDVDEDGMRVVTWDGVLTDWELAKVVPTSDKSENPRQTPRQPERTGTWQFMSVAYVRNHLNLPVSVADELESFFHVLLFYAVRLLRHNLKNVPFFVSNYFDTFKPLGNAARTCSEAKSSAMRHGSVAAENGERLKFMDPSGAAHVELNAMFGAFLRRFKARYEVLSWELRKSRAESAPSPASPQAAQQGTIQAAARTRLKKRCRHPANPIANLEGSSTEAEPSELMKSLAERLNSHQDFLDILANATDPDRVPAPVWPETDAVQDRLPDTYDPRLLLSLMKKMCTASGLTTADEDHDGAPPRKKMRTDLSEPRSGASMPPPPVRAQTVDTPFGACSARPTNGRKGRAQDKGKGGARG
ncbi:hypothetical protein BN946_scf184810.g2 [Trametes cinnabarina]|uniref:Fungal-type protein kinase domain-containing protein n=1 Tax=Pycnoporus cinnabarinus TaxID=5643 RepID=A0A060SU10_PYCCI|nr:hypothetical protein BN946_scf184810.g2 [Trametes cinnabarina]